MTEVREITFRALICDSSVISASVIPSTKNSWSASPDRLASGSTAIALMVAGAPAGAAPSSRPTRSHPATITSATTAAAPASRTMRRRDRPTPGATTAAAVPVDVDTACTAARTSPAR